MVGRQYPGNQGEILLLHALFNQLPLYFRQFGKNNKAGGLPVQPGNRMQVQLPALPLIIPADLGRQCSFIFFGCWVDEDAGWFVNNQERLVFITDV